MAVTTALLAATAIVPLAPSPAAAVPTVIPVTTTTDVIDGADGLTSLREAVALANTAAGDTEIVLTAATYPLSICGNGGAGPAANDEGDLNLARADTLAVAVTITGNGATITQTCPGYPHLHDDRTAAGSLLTITDATFTGATDAGLGVSIESVAGLTLDDVTITGNSFPTPGYSYGDHCGPNAAAVLVDGSEPVTLTDTEISHTTNAAGLVVVGAGADVAITGSTISYNDGNYEVAGALTCGRSTTVSNSTIAFNHYPAITVPTGVPTEPRSGTPRMRAGGAGSSSSATSTPTMSSSKATAAC